VHRAAWFTTMGPSIVNQMKYTLEGAFMTVRAPPRPFFVVPALCVGDCS
jgi:hypothetical protein